MHYNKEGMLHKYTTAYQGKLMSIDLFNMHFTYLEFVYVKLFVLAFALFGLYWMVVDIRCNQPWKIAKNTFLNHFLNYLEDKGEKRHDNLLEYFPGKIIPTQCIYYIDGKLVLKAHNKYINNVYQPEGYFLKMSENEYRLLFFYFLLKTLFNFKIFQYIALVLWLLLLLYIYLL